MFDLLAIVCALGVLLVRIGMAVHETGMLRAKNSVSAIVRNVTDVCIAALVFWAVGGAIFHWKVGLLFGSAPGDRAMMMRSLVTVLLGMGIVSGMIAERSRVGVGYACGILLAGLVIPLAGYWAKLGWLERLGYVDVAGASFIHLAAALVGLAACIHVGPRVGKYNRDGSSNAIPGHSLPLSSAGFLVMLAGWPAYVSGWGGAGAMYNTLLAGAAGGLASLGFSQLRYGKPDVHLLFGGILGGLVAMSAGGGAVASGFAVLIGAVAGLIVPALALWIDLIWRVDDPTSAAATHGVAGAWGIIAAGIFGPWESFGDKLKSIGVQTLGLLVIAALALGLGLALMHVLARVMKLRVKEADEFDGLDLADHDVGAYPDFQQTTIKSYHLREA